MLEPEAGRALAAALDVASSLGLQADDGILLNNSNKVALRILPSDVLARVAPAGEQCAQFEIDIAQRLAELGSPVAALDPRVEPRVYESDGFVVTLWTYYETSTTQPLSPAEYAKALEQLTAGLRKIDVPAPHFTDRVASAQQLLADRDQTPELPDADRELLSTTLSTLRRKIEERRPAEQLLHGEPHPGNLLATKDGPRFIDFETCCRGPVEFDLAHAPDEVAEHYPGIDQDLLRDCRLLVLAMVVTWRWDKADQLPNGYQRGQEWMTQLRAGLR
ncbi:thiamine kinase-like enzyme [Kribbella amoyensis]|uniref:Thiamine kinase-like enzyme n=1 Tax=Kribbella amoyensis TaxID=996641 RepID=A0A561C149_9ACTN|nr:aminoglycoside phosphotransferase family protein [Kribbella amoyensis]TWD84652.1 thiamine kinase-like enzyme [Kribbella amoyensis]